ncbi:hypothetical protein CHS0354_000924 [Potamilus streckersoni]|uniref:Uncharacterized protein n=1 Tax=Potamilus streckersoni TaxID=2493646 RepID=A0AAE0W7V8_9BIVA|nr:hypothetical protein CHS0354_000924 [Potamilus streckersoni]
MLSDGLIEIIEGMCANRRDYDWKSTLKYDVLYLIFSKHVNTLRVDTHAMSQEASDQPVHYLTTKLVQY